MSSHSTQSGFPTNAKDVGTDILSPERSQEKRAPILSFERSSGLVKFEIKIANLARLTSGSELWLHTLMKTPNQSPSCQSLPGYEVSKSETFLELFFPEATRPEDFFLISKSRGRATHLVRSVPNQTLRCQVQDLHEEFELATTFPDADISYAQFKAMHQTLLPLPTATTADGSLAAVRANEIKINITKPMSNLKIDVGSGIQKGDLIRIGALLAEPPQLQNYLSWEKNLLTASMDWPTPWQRNYVSDENEVWINLQSSIIIDNTPSTIYLPAASYKIAVHSSNSSSFRICPEKIVLLPGQTHLLECTFPQAKNHSLKNLLPLDNSSTFHQLCENLSTDFGADFEDSLKKRLIQFANVGSIPLDSYIRAHLAELANPSNIPFLPTDALSKLNLLPRHEICLNEGVTFESTNSGTNSIRRDGTKKTLTLDSNTKESSLRMTTKDLFVFGNGPKLNWAPFQGITKSPLTVIPNKKNQYQITLESLPHMRIKHLAFFVNNTLYQKFKVPDPLIISNKPQVFVETIIKPKDFYLTVLVWGDKTVDEFLFGTGFRQFFAVTKPVCIDADGDGVCTSKLN